MSLSSPAPEQYTTTNRLLPLRTAHQGNDRKQPLRVTRQRSLPVWPPSQVSNSQKLGLAILVGKSGSPKNQRSNRQIFSRSSKSTLRGSQRAIRRTFRSFSSTYWISFMRTSIGFIVRLWRTTAGFPISPSLRSRTPTKTGL